MEGLYGCYRTSGIFIFHSKLILRAYCTILYLTSCLSFVLPCFVLPTRTSLYVLPCMSCHACTWGPKLGLPESKLYCLSRVLPYCCTAGVHRL